VIGPRRVLDAVAVIWDAMRVAALDGREIVLDITEYVADCTNLSV
jgi:hypothetical protein